MKHSFLRFKLYLKGLVAFFDNTQLVVFDLYMFRFIQKKKING